MNENINSEKVTFENYYNSLPDGTKKRLLLEYMRMTEQSIGTFYNKKKNKRFTLVEKKLLEDLAKKNIAWD